MFLFDYLFYKNYMFDKKLGWLDGGDRVVSSAVVITLIELFSIEVISIILNIYIYHVNYKKETNSSIYLSLVFAAILMIINIFYYAKNADKIIDKYKDEGALKSAWGYVFWFVYGVGSFALAMWLAHIQLQMWK